jgi:polar amino acid transport system substrate-binding protein
LNGAAPKKKTRFQRNYFPGVFEGMYWALVTASTVGYGDKVPKRWAGRILTGILIVLFLPLSAFFIAQVSSDLTLQSIQSSISGLEDLWGKRVGVVRGTTSYDFMKHERAHLFAFRTAASAYDALDRDALDAVVYDAPALLHYANGAGRDKVRVVGKLFAPQDYGIALPQGSQLREGINRQILATLESGQIEEILTKWFGPNHRR